MEKTTCFHCGKEFETYKSSLKKAKHGKHFCSNKCRLLSMKGPTNPNWRGSTVFQKCIICGSEFKTNSFAIKRRKYGVKYCSKKCFAKGLIKKLTKEDAEKIIDALKKTDKTLPVFAKQYGTTDRILRRMLGDHSLMDEYETIVENKRIKKDEWYRKGRSFERLTRYKLQKLGYVVMPSPRSLGPADLLAVKNGTILLIQCKLYGTITKNERKKLIALSEQAGGMPLLCTKKEGKIIFTEIFNGVGKRRIEYEVTN